ncbi:unnamed protein product [Hymenolepis diminuta]|uniref:Uncharacterized protein n=1 Tax=Hymenolepis diminuta TaxID=6216 RepID=A0A564YYZ1_HYMDI|nr:unnamed protein product [Hymenolepis diminuta]
MVTGNAIFAQTPEETTVISNQNRPDLLPYVRIGLGRIVICRRKIEPIIGLQCPSVGEYDWSTWFSNTTNQTHKKLLCSFTNQT